MSASAVFRKHDFKVLTDESDNGLHEDLRRIEKKAREDDSDIDADDVKKAIKLFQDNVCVPHFPRRCTPPAFKAGGAIHALFSVAGSVVDRKKALKDEFYVSFYNFFVACIQAGPGTAHTEFAQTLYKEHSYADIKVYFHTFKEEKVRSFLKVLMHHYKSEEPDMEKIETYLHLMGHIIRGLCLNSMLEPHFANPSLAKDFVELLFFYLGQLKTDVHAEQRTWYGYFISSVQKNAPGKNPFKAIKDGGYLCECLKRVQDTYLDKTFSRDNPSIEKLASTLSKILTATLELNKMVECGETILDVVSVINVEGSSPDKNKLIEKIGTFFFHIKDKDAKGNTKLFHIIAAKFPEVLQHIKEPEIFSRLARGVVLDTLMRCTGKTPDFGAPWIKVIVGLIPIPHSEFMYSAQEPLRLIPNAFKWKNHPEWAADVFTAFKKLEFPEVSEENEREVDNLVDRCEDFLQHFLDQLKVAKLIPKFIHSMVELALSILEARRGEICDVGCKITSDFLILKGARKTRLLIFQKLEVILKDEDFPWMNHSIKQIAWQLVDEAVSSYKDGKEISEEENVLLISIFKRSLSQFEDFFEGYPVVRSIHYFIYTRCFTEFLSKHLATNTLPSCVDELITYLFEMRKYHEDSDDDEIGRLVASHFYMITKTSPQLFKNHLDQMTEIFVETSDMDIIHSVAKIYPESSTGFGSGFNDLFQKLNGTPDNMHALLAELLEKVSRRQPELFTEKHVERLMELFSTNPYLPAFSLMILKNIADKHPDRVRKNLSKLISIARKEQYQYYHVQEIITTVALNFKEEAEKVIEFVAKKWTDSKRNALVVNLCLHGLRTLASKYLEQIVKYRGRIVKCKSSYTDPNIQDHCTYLLNTIDGRSLEGIATDVQQQREDIDELETRVDNTENDVGELSTEVKNQKEDIKIVAGDVKKNEKRVDRVEEHVEELEDKVDEIDQKTMSNAPKWSRDVTKLMNPKCEKDWRLLAKRLGYKNEDLKAWSTQSDPCMAVLSEIYGTHKTKEANNAVLTALQEMNRTDAAIIVENAMKQAADVVEDEEFEYAVPPEVFLSYQWGHQKHVKILKKHLEMAGYTCWMDIGQMGGGDKLFEKIDKGIRGAKAIICCVTDKYAKSPNCNREVNLSVNLGKSMIPLLMEKSTWPPEGSMGPIFSEYLFIRFFQRCEEKTDDDRYWPVPKFQELLMQLNCYKILPDESAVDTFYQSWWKPVIEEIKIDTKTGKTATGESKTNSTKGKPKDKSPEVFISYQWGKQKQIMCLYKRLTEMGFNCWMDIHQMGGGDSLYDKIDRGVRGCSVVISSVTDKYALSANCRREVSLADALKKPIVPMLLEKVDWPPRGPMSMVFTEMLFINFYRDPDVQTNWTGPKFDELVCKLREHVPVGTDESKEESEKDRAQVSNSHGMKSQKATYMPQKQDAKNQANSGSPNKSETVEDSTIIDNTDVEVSDKKAALNHLNVKMDGEVDRQAKKNWRKVNNVRVATKSKSCHIL